MRLVSRPGTFSFFLEMELCTEVSLSGRQHVLALHLGIAFYFVCTALLQCCDLATCQHCSHSPFFSSESLGSRLGLKSLLYPNPFSKHIVFRAALP